MKNQKLVRNKHIQNALGCIHEAVVRPVDTNDERQRFVYTERLKHAVNYLQREIKSQGG